MIPKKILPSSSLEMSLVTVVIPFLKFLKITGSKLLFFLQVDITEILIIKIISLYLKKMGIIWVATVISMYCIVIGKTEIVY